MASFHAKLLIRLEAVLKANCSYLKPTALSEPLTERIQTRGTIDQRRAKTRRARSFATPINDSSLSNNFSHSNCPLRNFLSVKIIMIIVIILIILIIMMIIIINFLKYAIRERHLMTRRLEMFKTNSCSSKVSFSYRGVTRIFCLSLSRKPFEFLTIALGK